MRLTNLLKWLKPYAGLIAVALILSIVNPNQLKFLRFAQNTQFFI